MDNKQNKTPFRVTLSANDMADFLKDEIPDIRLGNGVQSDDGFTFDANASYEKVIQTINDGGGYSEECSSNTLSIYLDEENDTYITVKKVDDETTRFTMN